MELRNRLGTISSPTKVRLHILADRLPAIGVAARTVMFCKDLIRLPNDIGKRPTILALTPQAPDPSHLDIDLGWNTSHDLEANQNRDRQGFMKPPATQAPRTAAEPRAALADRHADPPHLDRLSLQGRPRPRDEVAIQI